MSINQSSTLNKQAVAALNGGQPLQVIALLQPVCDESCTDPQQWLMLGAALGMTGNIPGAEQAFRESLRLNPGDVQALVNLGRALAEQEKYTEVADTMEQVLGINPGHRQALIGYINSLAHLQRFAEAEECCNLLTKNNQGDVEALTLLGNVHKLKGEYGFALTLFDQALGVDPKFVSAHMNKGLVLNSMGRVKAAIESFEQARLLAPENPTIWFIKGMTHITMNNLEQAAKDLEEAFRLNPSDVNTGGQLANVYRHLRRLPESAEVSRRILLSDPDNVRAKFYLEAFRSQENKQLVQRIPREVAEATYNHADVGRNFESSLKGGLEYKAPDVLDHAIRENFGHQQGVSLDILEIGCGTGLCGSRFADISKTLVGTDLSPSMLDVAREKNVYSELYVSDLIDVLSDNPHGFDLVIAMDVLCYFGDLTEIFQKCHDTLRVKGVFALSVEKPDEDDLWMLHPYGHFVHSLRHLQQAARVAGFEELFVKEMVLRREALEKRVGYVCLFRRK